MTEEKLVAVVNGKEISRADVMKFLNDMGPQTAMQFQSPEGIKTVIDEMINQELLFLDAIDTKMEEEIEFKEILEATKLKLLKNYAFNKLLSNIDATEEEINSHYNEFKDSFNKPETVKASHILVDSEEKANEVIADLNNELSFADAAIKYSSCPSKEAGGSLGEFTRGQMVPEFEDAAFSMEEGTISSPVKSQFGYHIIKLDEKSSANESTLEDVQEEVYNQVIRMKQQAKYMGRINELKGKYKVEMF